MRGGKHEGGLSRGTNLRPEHYVTGSESSGSSSSMSSPSVRLEEHRQMAPLPAGTYDDTRHWGKGRRAGGGRGRRVGAESALVANDGNNEESYVKQADSRAATATA